MLEESSGLSAEPSWAHLILRELFLSLQPLEIHLPDSAIRTDHLNRDFLITFKIDILFFEKCIYFKSLTYVSSINGKPVSLAINRRGPQRKCMATQTQSKRFRQMLLPLEGFVLRLHSGSEGDQRVLEEVKGIGAPD